MPNSKLPLWMQLLEGFDIRRGPTRRVFVQPNPMGHSRIVICSSCQKRAAGIRLAPQRISSSTRFLAGGISQHARSAARHNHYLSQLRRLPELNTCDIPSSNSFTSERISRPLTFPVSIEGLDSVVLFKQHVLPDAAFSIHTSTVIKSRFEFAVHFCSFSRTVYAANEHVQPTAIPKATSFILRSLVSGLSISQT